MLSHHDTPPRTFCQPDATKSCGACCGLYNHTSTSYEYTLAKLTSRTLAYRASCGIHDTASLVQFRAKWEDPAQEKLLDGLPSCPFLGLLDLHNPDSPPTSSRVGCLVHPLQNNGIDGRDCGVYDRFICEDYLCASHDLMRPEEVRLVLNATHDSYLYGLIITDVRLVRSCIEAAAQLLGAYPQPHLLARPAVIAAAADLFELRRAWPWAAPDAAFGQVIPLTGLNTRRRPRPATTLGVESDPLTDTILTCLGTHVEDLASLLAARATIRAALEPLADALRHDA